MVTRGRRAVSLTTGSGGVAGPGVPALRGRGRGNCASQKHQHHRASIALAPPPFDSIDVVLFAAARKTWLPRLRAPPGRASDYTPTPLPSPDAISPGRPEHHGPVCLGTPPRPDGFSTTRPDLARVFVHRDKQTHHTTGVLSPCHDTHLQHSLRLVPRAARRGQGGREAVPRGALAVRDLASLQTPARVRGRYGQVRSGQVRSGQVRFV